MDRSLEDTTALREKLLRLWAQFEKGELSAQEARVHIGFARAIVETLKAEIAAAHIGAPLVTLGIANSRSRPPLTLARRKN
jgi:hypothetical protein